MALRTDDSASSGLTSKAGGGLRPIRSSAPSTSASTPRRAASDLADLVTLQLERLQAVGNVLDVLAELLLGLGRLDHRRGQRRGILLHCGDVGGELVAPLVGKRQFLGDPIVFGSALRLPGLDFRRGLGTRHGRPQQPRGRRRADRQDRRFEDHRHDRHCR